MPINNFWGSVGGSYLIFWKFRNPVYSTRVLWKQIIFNILNQGEWKIFCFWICNKTTVWSNNVYLIFVYTNQKKRAKSTCFYVIYLKSIGIYSKALCAFLLCSLFVLIKLMYRKISNLHYFMNFGKNVHFCCYIMKSSYYLNFELFEERNN